MGNLSRILISLPLIVVPLMAATPHASAGQGMRPHDAVRLLAQSAAIDERCNHLSAADHQQLADYVARAEVASAQLDGVTVTRNARLAGTSQGKAMACDARSKGLVTATLAAARIAEKRLGPQIAALEKKAKQHKVARTQPAQRQQSQVAALRQPPAEASQSLFSLSGSEGGLDLYTRHAAAYYVERHCGFLASSQTMDFWKLIVERHNAMISRFGGSAVAGAKARAESAGAAACSSETRVFVRSAYNDIQRYR